MVFYRLGTSGVQSWVCGVNDDLSLEEWQALIFGKTITEGPVEIQVASGERLPDHLTASVVLHAASPRMERVLSSISATGYSIFPIVLKHPILGCVIGGYSGLAIAGRGGPLNEGRMQPIKKSGDTIIACNGYHIYEDRWDGSDVFTIEGLGFSVWVTERVAKALQKARPKLGNLHLTPNTEPWPGRIGRR